jgi:predicted CoA-binding protein
VPHYLIDNGYNVFPMNPKASESWKKSYGSVAEVREEVEIVDVFRRSKELLK